MANATDVQRSVEARSRTARRAERTESGAGDVAALFDRIDSIDAALLAAVERRTELARLVARADAAAGTPSGRPTDEPIGARFESLGQEGRSLGRLLNRLAAVD